MLESNKVIHVDFLASRDVDTQYHFLEFAIDACQIATGADKVIDGVIWQNSCRTRYEVDISTGSESTSVVVSLYSMQDLMDYTLFYVESNNSSMNFYNYDEMLEFFRDLMIGEAEDVDLL